ncbi:hypothetical protein BN1708_019379, partial [Verticillium longisporum]
PRQWRH